MMSERIRLSGVWLLVLSVLVCAMDARPAANLSLKDPSSPSASLHSQDSILTRDGEFWTRWNSDVDSPHESNGKQINTGLFSAEDGANFGSKVHQERIISLERGCGRGQNRLATLGDGTKACCRYRQLQWRDIRGEFYAYHLNNLLGLHNAPPATLIKLNFSSPQWEAVLDAAAEAEWTDHTTIIMTLFVERLTDETIPPPLREQSTVKETDLESASPEERSRILQWSDLIIFDFLIGHSDRIFNTLFNLQWNSHMLSNPVHNLLKTERDDKLLLFDNESGFWMGYKMGWKEPLKYELQANFLRKLCVFRSRTIDKVKRLLYGEGREESDRESPAKRLERYIRAVDEASFKMVEPLSREQSQEFSSRLKLVLEQVEKCDDS